jgi:hypothetical protein
MGRNVDMETLTCDDPITLEKIINPYCCHFCMNVFEKDSFI